jgi:hypothetical protein
VLQERSRLEIERHRNRLQIDLQDRVHPDLGRRVVRRDRVLPTRLDEVRPHGEPGGYGALVPSCLGPCVLGIGPRAPDGAGNVAVVGTSVPTAYFPPQRLLLLRLGALGSSLWWQPIPP